MNHLNPSETRILSKQNKNWCVCCTAHTVSPGQNCVAIASIHQYVSLLPFLSPSICPLFHSLSLPFPLSLPILTYLPPQPIFRRMNIQYIYIIFSPNMHWWAHKTCSWLLRTLFNISHFYLNLLLYLPSYHCHHMKHTQHDCPSSMNSNLKLSVNSSDAGDGIIRLWWSIPCLLMHWLLKSPVHQQAWYWLCRTDNISTYSRVNFIYLGPTKSKIWFKMWIYLL